MPDVFKLMFDGNCKELARQIKAGINVNGIYPPYKASPLYNALGGCEPSIGMYRAMFLVLEAGADPLQEHPGDEFWKTTFPLLKALSSHNLAQVLMLIWYVEYDDYKTIPFHYNESGSYVCTFASYIKAQNKTEMEAGKARKYAQCIEQVATDAILVRNLFSAAERALATLPLTAREYEAAAGAYEAAAKIYKKNEDLEDTRVYYRSDIWRDSATTKELHALFKEHYREKQQDCIAKQFKCYELAEKSLAIPAAIYDEQADFDYHKALLEKLMGFYAEKRNEVDRLYCLRRLAVVLSKAPAKVSDRVEAHAAAPVSAAGVELTMVLPGEADSAPVGDSSAAADAHETTSLLAAAPPSAGGSIFSIFGSGQKQPPPTKPVGAAVPCPVAHSVSRRI